MKSSHYRVNDFISGALESSIDPAILKDLAPYINIKVIFFGDMLCSMWRFLGGSEKKESSEFK